jgi:aryl-alcohol dehydrogenase-like predicted oxidoreductase
MTPTLNTKLGMTGLEVFPIAFGAWELGGEWGSPDDGSAPGDDARVRGMR